MIPTRGRRTQCERLLKSFEETVSVRRQTDLLFITDGDDQETYQGMDWGSAEEYVLDPRESLTGKLNTVAMQYADQYNALMFAGDDHVFETDDWDEHMLSSLEKMQGTGMVFPDDKRRYDVPEIIMISSDIVKFLGWFAEPGQKHYFIDNIWAELGGRAGFIRWCPGAVIRHLHYSMDSKVVRDVTYTEAETSWGDSDGKAYQEWRQNTMPFQAAQLRRRFSKDLDWLFSKI